ncbi:MAG: UDP-N-acetylmuramyl-tripeptide synthetase [Gammaproteobacteria bacterium]|nr:UDP-N-acetylmuramyl-tripeptide synthetase [Gammaproteobacteria bacterium]
MNSDIKDIINFTKKIKPKILNFRTIFSFSSKDNCKGKIMILIVTSNKNIYGYINESLKKGADGIIVSIPVNKELLARNVPVFYTNYLNTNFNKFLDYIYNKPLKNKNIIGITGTDGKTSTCHLLANSLSKLGKKVGIISTEGNGIYPRLKPSSYTTPRSDILYKLFDKFRKNNVEVIFIECSSQGLHQGRLDNIIFNDAIITNLNRDHIEYHQTFKKYAESKLKLLKMTKGNIFINQNCKNSISVFSSIKKSKTIFYGTKKDLINAHRLIDRPDTSGDMISQYNSSLLYKFLHTKGYSLKNIKTIINARTKKIKGRMNYINDKNNNAVYIVDYAHTEYAMTLLLRYAKIKTSKSFLITVFGCGGNRDRGKRSKMGIVAKKYSDKIILTDDNPRGEKSADILKDIHEKIKDKSNILIIPNRKRAIKTAYSMSTKECVIVLAGKGNEDHITYHNKRLNHNDIDYLKTLIR